MTTIQSTHQHTLAQRQGGLFHFSTAAQRLLDGAPKAEPLGPIDSFLSSVNPRKLYKGPNRSSLVPIINLLNPKSRRIKVLEDGTHQSRLRHVPVLDSKIDGSVLTFSKAIIFFDKVVLNLSPKTEGQPRTLEILTPGQPPHRNKTLDRFFVGAIEHPNNCPPLKVTQEKMPDPQEVLEFNVDLGGVNTN